MVADASLGSVYSSLTSIDLKPRCKHTASASSHATVWIFPSLLIESCMKIEVQWIYNGFIIIIIIMDLFIISYGEILKHLATLF